MEPSDDIVNVQEERLDSMLALLLLLLPLLLPSLLLLLLVDWVCDDGVNWNVVCCDGLGARN